MEGRRIFACIGLVLTQWNRKKKDAEISPEDGH